MRREEFAGILWQVLENGSTFYLRILYASSDLNSLQLETPLSGTFIIPFDSNLRLAINTYRVPEQAPRAGWDIILIQRLFRSIPDIMNHFGYGMQSMRGESQGRNALDVPDPDTASKLWKLLNQDSEISFREFAFSKGDTVFSIGNDAVMKIARPRQGSAEFLLAIMDLAEGEKELCNAAVRSIGEKRRDGDVLLQTPILLRDSYDKIISAVKLRKQFHVTTHSSGSCSVSFRNGVFQVIKIQGGSALIPDPAFSVAEVMSFLDGPWEVLNAV